MGEAERQLLPLGPFGGEPSGLGATSEPNESPVSICEFPLFSLSLSLSLPVSPRLVPGSNKSLQSYRVSGQITGPSQPYLRSPVRAPS